MLAVLTAMAGTFLISLIFNLHVQMEYILSLYNASLVQWLTVVNVILAIEAILVSILWNAKLFSFPNKRSSWPLLMNSMFSGCLWLGSCSESVLNYILGHAIFCQSQQWTGGHEIELNVIPGIELAIWAVAVFEISYKAGIFSNNVSFLTLNGLWGWCTFLPFCVWRCQI